MIELNATDIVVVEGNTGKIKVFNDLDEVSNYYKIPQTRVVGNMKDNRIAKQLNGRMSYLINQKTNVSLVFMDISTMIMR